MQPRRLRFHVNPGHTVGDVRFELDPVDGETVAELKARVSAPKHPITGESTCPWDGNGPLSGVEY